MSAVRKSATVGMPVSWAMTAGSPICSVEGTAARPKRRPWGWCQIVWPCEPIKVDRANGDTIFAAGADQGLGEETTDEKVEMANVGRRAAAGGTQTQQVLADGHGPGDGLERDHLDRGALAPRGDVDDCHIDPVQRGSGHQSRDPPRPAGLSILRLHKGSPLVQGIVPGGRGIDKTRLTDSGTENCTPGGILTIINRERGEVPVSNEGDARWTTIR